MGYSEYSKGKKRQTRKILVVSHSQFSEYSFQLQPLHFALSIVLSLHCTALYFKQYCIHIVKWRNTNYNTKSTQLSFMNEMAEN